MSNLNENFETMFKKMENFVSTKTVVGEPMKLGDTTIIPLVDVTFGLGAGSKANDSNHTDGAAGGLGAKISPTAVMIIQGGNVQILNVSNQTAVDKIMNMAPGIMSKLNFSAGTRQRFEDEVISKSGEE